MRQHDRAQLAVLVLWSQYCRRSATEPLQIMDAISDMLVLCDVRGYDINDMLRGAMIMRQQEILGYDDEGEEDMQPPTPRM